MERLDKVISNQVGYSRKEVKELVKKKRVKVDGIVVANSDIKVDTSINKITGEQFEFNSIRSCADNLGLNRKTITAILKEQKTNNYILL